MNAGDATLAGKHPPGLSPADDPALLGLRRCLGSCSEPGSTRYVRPSEGGACPNCGGALGEPYRRLACGAIETSPRLPFPLDAFAILDELRATMRDGGERRQREEPVAVDRRSRLDRRGGALGVLPTMRTR